MYTDQKIKIGKKIIYIPDAFDVMISRQEDTPLVPSTEKHYTSKSKSKKNKKKIIKRFNLVYFSNNFSSFLSNCLAEDSLFPSI